MANMDEAAWSAAQLIWQADALIIAAGAGMGVDSGLPDFRGNQGFWQAYPALAKAGIDFRTIANPESFRADVRQAWGFYGHRLGLYRSTVPHEGFAILRSIASRLQFGSFVQTSNVDGQFQKAGWGEENVVEIHGSIHRLQCFENCRSATWAADEFVPLVDEDQCRLLGPIPVCIHCGRLARPNILLFNDWGWNECPSTMQSWRFNQWRAQLKSPVVVELGAGTHIPSVRAFSEMENCPIIRINLREAGVPSGKHIGLAVSALEGLRAIQECLNTVGFFDN